MKKVEFGFSNDVDPKGSWEGIGIKNGLLLTEADYYGCFNVADDTYMLAKVTNDEHNRYPELKDRFIVRPAIYDMYKDGSGFLMLDQEESVVSNKLETLFNNPHIKDKITTIQDIPKYCEGAKNAPICYKLIEMVPDEMKINATSITHISFDKKNEAIKACHSTISEMQNSLSESGSMSNSVGKQ